MELYCQVDPVLTHYFLEKLTVTASPISCVRALTVPKVSNQLLTPQKCTFSFFLWKDTNSRDI